MARTRYLQAAVEIDARWGLLRRSAAALAALAPPPDGVLERGSDDSASELWPDCRSFEGAFDRIVPVPSIAHDPAPLTMGSLPWRPMFDAYAAEAKLAPSTIKRWTGVLAALEEAVDTDDLALVTRADLIVFRRGIRTPFLG